MKGDAVTGFWNVNVVADGEYEIRLRRWPEETDKAIVEALRAIDSKSTNIAIVLDRIDKAGGGPGMPPETMRAAEID